ncbi:Syd protein [Streptomyces sp. NBRC 110611]|uniref:hypothetical protein n=1 Tax=Streptomyces sp. NBRC 110611 TaxID=1621259 RepID=UPI000857E08E|nr:hypothetical protein [Streptomyces sp. NBRC 110611]GAU65711.1 Syd protein [Streptomyces sp. NBRC 110611]
MCGRLLLFTALLFGIVTMHTLGHPAEHSAPSMADGGLGTAASAPAHHAAAASVTDVSVTDAPRADGDAPRAHHPAPLGGMDPMSVCLAVLGAATLALLFCGVLARRPADVPATVLARLPHALRPIPPPPRGTLLAQLSVLRV